MKIIKCPVCAKLIDSKDIEKGSWRSNPFVRRSIKCANCGSKIKTKIWLIISFWLWVVVGFYFMFSEYESTYTSVFILGAMGIMFASMRLGLGYESEENT